MQSALKHKLLAGGLAATAVLGVGAVASAASGVGPFDSDDTTSFAGSAGSAGTGGTAVTQASGGAGEVESQQVIDLPIGAIQTFTAGPAGTVTVTRGEGVLGIAGIGPAAGFVVDEQQAAGREVEVRFVSGGLVVRFDAEIEDGVVRIRVRQRGAGATGGTTASSLTPATVDDRGGDDRGGDDDNSGPGGGDDDSDDSGSGSGSGSSGHGGGDD